MMTKVWNLSPCKGLLPIMAHTLPNEFGIRAALWWNRLGATIKRSAWWAVAGVVAGTSTTLTVSSASAHCLLTESTANPLCWYSVAEVSLGAALLALPLSMAAIAVYVQHIRDEHRVIHRFMDGLKTAQLIATDGKQLCTHFNKGTACGLPADCCMFAKLDDPHYEEAMSYTPIYMCKTHAQRCKVCCKNLMIKLTKTDEDDDTITQRHARVLYDQSANHQDEEVTSAPSAHGQMRFR
jgi:hypothetical protein